MGKSAMGGFLSFDFRPLHDRVISRPRRDGLSDEECFLYTSNGLQRQPQFSGETSWKHAFQGPSPRAVPAPVPIPETFHYPFPCICMCFSRGLFFPGNWYKVTKFEIQPDLGEKKISLCPEPHEIPSWKFFLPLWPISWSVHTSCWFGFAFSMRIPFCSTCRPGEKPSARYGISAFSESSVTLESSVNFRRRP